MIPGRRIFCTDCEGPISKNDNALELTAHFLPGGDLFFAQISRYDDYLADVAKRPGYKAGDTLRLILPFLKAYGATNQKIEQYCLRNILLMPGAKQTLQYISKLMPAFIISTSYRPYMRSLCKVVDFPEQRVVSTELDIDRYELKQPELNRLRQLREEIATLPLIELPPDADCLDKLPVESQRTIQRLDQIFWEEIPTMEAGRMLIEVNPVGGREKAAAVVNILRATGGKLEDVIYVGDSITDVEAFQMVREGGGLAVCLNGNRYAIRAAEIASVSEQSTILCVLGELFCRGGKQMVLEVAGNWSLSELQRSQVNRCLVEKLSEFSTLPEVEIVSEVNIQELIERSESFRKSVRGEKVGRLG